MQSPHICTAAALLPAPQESQGRHAPLLASDALLEELQQALLPHIPHLPAQLAAAATWAFVQLRRPNTWLYNALGRAMEQRLMQLVASDAVMVGVAFVQAGWTPQVGGLPAVAPRQLCSLLPGSARCLHGKTRTASVHLPRRGVAGCQPSCTALSRPRHPVACAAEPDDTHGGEADGVHAAAEGG